MEDPPEYLSRKFPFSFLLSTDIANTVLGTSLKHTVFKVPRDKMEIYGSNIRGVPGGSSMKGALKTPSNLLYTESLGDDG